jgi:putative nucleotidyltransferase with HDIG domain
MDYTKLNEIKIDTIKSQFQNNNEFSCTIPFTSRETDIFLSHALRSILEELKQENMFIHLEYVINELTANASKANSKRLYFKEIGMDINNPAEYEKGIKNFKDDVFKDFKTFEQIHRDKNSSIKVTFKKEEEYLQIQISNNSPLLQIETKRIAENFQISHKFEDLTDIFTQQFDATEGRGFGLVIIILMLRKLNLTEQAITYQNIGENCITSIAIPISRLSEGHGVVIASEIAREITKMPQFPESIIALQKELGDPNCSFESIADKIISDPALTAEILRIANSPVYIVRNKINDVAGAVRMMGMLGVKSVLYNYGVNKIMHGKYEKKVIQQINDHSYSVALTAAFLADYKKLGKIAEDIYVTALLHDMGKIIVNALNSDLEQKLKALCTKKHIPISILEDLTKGYNHSLIGAEVAKKWDFPEKFIKAIQFHHRPLEVDEEFQTLTYAVYLGNEIYYYMKGERDFYDINFMVLNYFELEAEEHFYEFIQSLKVGGLGFKD